MARKRIRPKKATEARPDNIEAIVDPDEELSDAERLAAEREDFAKVLERLKVPPKFRNLAIKDMGATPIAVADRIFNHDFNANRNEPFVNNVVIRGQRPFWWACIRYIAMNKEPIRIITLDELAVMCARDKDAFKIETNAWVLAIDNYFTDGIDPIPTNLREPIQDALISRDENGKGTLLYDRRKPDGPFECPHSTDSFVDFLIEEYVR